MTPLTTTVASGSGGYGHAYGDAPGQAEGLLVLLGVVIALVGIGSIGRVLGRWWRMPR